jgi:hypothetical protein
LSFCAIHYGVLSFQTLLHTIYMLQISAVFNIDINPTNSSDTIKPLHLSNVKYSRLIHIYHLEADQDRLSILTYQLFMSTSELILLLKTSTAETASSDQAQHQNRLSTDKTLSEPKQWPWGYYAYNYSTWSRSIAAAAVSGSNSASRDKLTAYYEEMTFQNYAWLPSNLINHGVGRLQPYICPSRRLSE